MDSLVSFAFLHSPPIKRMPDSQAMLLVTNVFHANIFCQKSFVSYCN